MTKKTLLCTLVSIAAMGLSSACSKNKAKQTAAKALHTSAECPVIAAGSYAASDAASHTISFKSASDSKVTDVSLDSSEWIPIDGTQHTLKDGSQLTTSCIGSKTLWIVGFDSGKDKDKQQLDMKITAKDKDVQSEITEPLRESLTFSPSAIAAVTDLTAKPFVLTYKAKPSEESAPKGNSPAAPASPLAK
jgi:hypothetical protein